MLKLSKEEFEAEKAKKQKYLNDEIISKGYNPEDLSNFIIRMKGQPPDYMLFEDYVDIIEDFKNEKLTQTYSSVSEPKKKEVSLYDLFYSPQTYKVQTKPQEPSPLSQNKNVSISIGNPVKVEGGFFSSSYYTYEIKCEIIKSCVRRSYNDFDWLKNKLIEVYPYTLIPPLPKTTLLFKENDINSVNMRIRYLNKFFDVITRKKILRESPLVYNFITLNDEAFPKYKDKISKDKFVLKNDLSNYPSSKEEIEFSLSKEIAVTSNSLYTALCPSLSLYTKLNNSFTSLVTQFKSLSTTMNDISTILSQLEVRSKATKQSETVQKMFSTLSNVFESWSKGYDNQSTMFNNDIREFFDYMNSEMSMLESFNSEFVSVRSTYEASCMKLREKKENLYMKKEYAKWDINPNIKEDFKNIEKDKEKCFNLMCYKETTEINQLKEKLTLIMNMIIQQYKKLCKYQSERAKVFITGLAGNKSTILSDAFSLIKLFSIQL